jgi:hypothetical protein
VARAYYLKTGTASRDLPAPPVPKTYTFGVKVLNENGNLSPAATWTFKMKASTVPPVGGEQEEGGTAEPENPFKKIKVTFDSITIHNDHDSNSVFGILSASPSLYWSGEWSLDAYVQGKLVRLLDRSISGGDTFYFKDKEVSVNVHYTQPLSIFVTGMESDDGFLTSCFRYGPLVPGGCGFCAARSDYGPKIAEILKQPPTSWNAKLQDIHVTISGARCEPEMMDNIGYITRLILPPDYKSWLTPEQIANAQTGTISKYALGGAIGPDFATESSTRDFMLRYTVSVEPIDK